MQNNIAALVSQIAVSFVSHRELPSAAVPGLVRSILSTLRDLSDGGAFAAYKKSLEPVKTPDPAAFMPRLIKAARSAFATSEPKADPRKSVFNSGIVCLSCGKFCKVMRSHLHFSHKLSVEQYRELWNLPASYPMTAPEYSRSRSFAAKGSGLGKLNHFRGRGVASK